MRLETPVLFVVAALLGGCATPGSAPPGSPEAERGGRGSPASAPERVYRLYVANESSDLVSRVVFSPSEGARIERDIPVGVMPADTDGPHGLAVSPDGEHWYVTLAHGTPDGRLWKFHAGPDTLVARTTLGRFPASLGTDPDGRFVFIVNFNLHGDMVPSELSVVYAPTLTEVSRVVSCLMPHGSRTAGSGRRHYHVCMHSDQLVELGVPEFRISHRFSLGPGSEGLLDLDDRGEHAVAPSGDPAAHGGHAGHEPAAAPGPERRCSPTWVVPARGPSADRFVYVACNRADEVLEVDVSSWRVTRRFATGRGPYNLDTSPDGRLLVVTLKGDQGIAVVDLGTGEERARLETSRPITHGVVIDPESRYAFVTNESIGSVRGTLDVFDLRSLERVATVELHHQPGGIDLWRVEPAEGR